MPTPRSLINKSEFCFCGLFRGLNMAYPQNCQSGARELDEIALDESPQVRSNCGVTLVDRIRICCCRMLRASFQLDVILPRVSRLYCRFDASGRIEGPSRQDTQPQKPRNQRVRMSVLLNCHCSSRTQIPSFTNSPNPDSTACVLCFIRQHSLALVCCQCLSRANWGASISRFR